MAKQITNQDLLREIQGMQANLVDHNSRILNLEAAKIATDAVADYLVKHPAQTAAETRINKELLKYIGVALSIISALIYLLQGARP